MTPLGTPMPTLALPDVVSARLVTGDDLDRTKPSLVLFICVHCPFTAHLVPALRAVVRDYGSRINLLAISANDPAQVPEDAPAGLRRLAAALELTGPFLYDETGETARDFGAECTPECFLYDAERRLVYRGEIDGSRPRGPVEPSAAPLRAALDAVLAGAAVDPQQRPGMGCNIKWRRPVGRAVPALG
jgi:hypothetical protein